MYLKEHAPSEKDMYRVVRDVIETKDYWICITKNHAVIVDGLKVNGLTFGDSKFYRDSRVLKYELEMKTPSEDEECTKVPMELRFHWKNGGQGVQNINFLLK